MSEVSSAVSQVHTSRKLESGAELELEPATLIRDAAGILTVISVPGLGAHLL